MSALAALAAAVATSSLGPVVTYGGAGFNIPDSNPVGASSTINVAESGPLVSVTITLKNLTHTWVGDLIATLTNANGNVFLFNRIGRVNTGFGDSSDFGGDYTFSDTGPYNPLASGDIWAEAALGGGTYILRSGTYYASGANSAAQISMFNALQGDINGNWTLNISDNAGGDVGALGAWNITIEYIPAPGAIALLGLAGLAGRRRRA